MRKSNSALGGILVIIGGLLLAARFLFNKPLISLGPDDFWPMIILLAGAGFELAYFISLKAPGLLVPGGMLTTYGLLFFFETATNWKFAEYTWPIYLIGIVAGLFQLYMHIGRPKGLLISICIIAGIASACFIVMLFRVFLGTVDLAVVIPLILIGGGLILFFGRSGSTKNRAW